MTNARNPKVELKYMIPLNPRYEALFDTCVLDWECDGIVQLMSIETDMMKEALEAGLYKLAVTMCLQLLKAAGKRGQCRVLLEHCRA